MTHLAPILQMRFGLSLKIQVPEATGFAIQAELNQSTQQLAVTALITPHRYHLKLVHSRFPNQKESCFLTHQLINLEQLHLSVLALILLIFQFQALLI